MNNLAPEDITTEYFRTTAARSYAPTPEHYQAAADGWYRRLRPWMPVNRSAVCLELGCGCGEVVYLLERLGFNRTTGVDVCAEELDHARRFVKGDLVKGDVREYVAAIGQQSVDWVFALNLLEHLAKNDVIPFLRNIRRALKPGGGLILMVPNAISPFGSLTRHWDFTHEWAFTPNNFRQIAPLTGFDQNIEFRECGPVPYGFVSGARYALWQLIRAATATRLLIELGTTKDRIYTMDMLVRLRTA